MKITSIHAREILDSRGNPTIEVDVCAEPKTQNTGRETVFGRGVAPSGASTGIHEAHELRDGGSRYGGKGVLDAVENVNKKISKALVGKNLKGQKDADARLIKLDGTPNKLKLGANATVATSMAIARCFACEGGKQYFAYLGGSKLPQPMFNILNGGKHAGGKLGIQEFMIMPKGRTFGDTLRMASEIYHLLGKNLVNLYGPAARNVGDEGGFAPPIEKTEDALNVIWEAVEEAGYGNATTLAMDCAASSFYDSITKTYSLDGKGMGRQVLLDYYVNLAGQYRLTSIEDPFEEEDFEGFAQLTEALKGKTHVVGDDLLVTNPERIGAAIEKKSCNVLLLKLNQIGTVTEALDAAELCKKAGWKVIVSHRSGETEDSFIADFSVGINADYIKTGASARGERTAKYNQLLRISEMIG